MRLSTTLPYYPTKIKYLFSLILTTILKLVLVPEVLVQKKLLKSMDIMDLIESSTMKTYVEIAQEWGSEVDVETANDDEIEIFGATGNYYIYIKSWE